MKRNLSIDLAKIIAMYFVLALHLFVATDLEPCFLKTHWWSIFGIAIPMFFMVSGFLMWNKDITFHYVIRKIGGIIRFIFITVTPYVIYLWVKGDTNAWKYYFECLHQYSYWGVYWYFGGMMILYMLSPYILQVMKSKYYLWLMGGGISCVPYSIHFKYLLCI